HALPLPPSGSKERSQTAHAGSWEFAHAPETDSSLRWRKCSDSLDAGAGDAGSWCRYPRVETIVFAVLENERTGAVQAAGIDFEVVSECGVDAQEAIFANLGATGDHHMGSDEDVVLDAAMVAQMVTAPDGHVVANLDIRLDCDVLENEAI